MRLFHADLYGTRAAKYATYNAMKDFIGVVDSEGDGTLSQNTGKAFTDYVVEKHRQGKL